MKKKSLICMLAAALFCCACQESLEEKAARECQQYTKKNCPAAIDKNVIVDSLTFDAATHTLHFHYTLTGVADSVGLLSREEVRKALIDQLHNTTMMRMYKEADYNFAYTYYSQRRPELVLFEETLTAKDYQ